MLNTNLQGKQLFSVGAPLFNGRRLGLIFLLFIAVIVFILLYSSNQKHTQRTAPADEPPKKEPLKEPVSDSVNVEAGLTAAQQPAELLEHHANNFCSLYTHVFPYEAIHLQRKHIFNSISLPPHHSCIFMFLCFH